MKTLRKLLVVVTVTLALPLGTATNTLPAHTTTAWHIQTQSELECLAKNIYHESRGEPFHGKVAVAQVTLNRAKSKKYSGSICKVVYQPKQFSWTIGKVGYIKDKAAWREATNIAKAMLKGTVSIPNFNAMYFHTKQVNPVWNKHKQVVQVIGNHIFYV